MAEYIEREAVKKAMEDLWKHYLKINNFHAEIATENCIELVEEAPAADVVEVKRGFWKPYRTPLDSRQEGWICTHCSGVQSDLSNGNTDYCPDCGAVMEYWEDEDAAD